MSPNLNMSKSKPKQIKRVEIRWDPDDYHVVEERAGLCDLNISEFIRRATMARKVTPSVDHHAIAELRRLGGLLKHLYPKNTNWTSEEKKRYWSGYEQLLETANRIEAKHYQPGGKPHRPKGAA